MRRPLALLACGMLALAIQAGLATVLPRPWCPDLGLLVVIAIGLTREGLVSGFLLAAGLGYAADLGSGSLLGQHALLRLFAFSAARVASSQLNLGGAMPLAAFAFGATLLYGLALAGSSAFFGASGSGGWPSMSGLLGHALANTLAAPLVGAAIREVAQSSLGDERTSRTLRLHTRNAHG